MLINELTINSAKPNSSHSNNFEWRAPAKHPFLADDEIHVWLIRLDKENRADTSCTLSDDELARAARFRFERDRNRFVAARGFLRKMLANYLQIDGREIRFQYNSHGKPLLHRELKSPLGFNVSHSENAALFAFARNAEIGVDIERINASFVDEAMIRHCLTPREISRFRGLAAPQQTLFFFECWTRKEAFLKAIGNGLSISPNEIETVCLSNYPIGGFTDSTDFRANYLSIENLPAIENFAAAVSFERASRKLKFWKSFAITIL